MTGIVTQFEDLECWKEARKLVKTVYSTTNIKQFSRDFGLRDQIRRASISVMSNVAEGFGNHSNYEFVRFLGYASRSCSEVRSHLYVAFDVGYISTDIFGEIAEQTMKCSNYIKGLIKYLKGKTSKNTCT